MITTSAIIQSVCEYYGVTKGELTGKNRSRKFVRPRHVAMLFSRELAGASLPRIGSQLGGRDHTTILLAIRSVKKVLERDARFAAGAHKLRGRLAYLGELNDLDALSGRVYEACAAQAVGEEKHARRCGRKYVKSPLTAEQREKLRQSALRYWASRRAALPYANSPDKYGTESVAA